MSAALLSTIKNGGYIMKNKRILNKVMAFALSAVLAFAMSATSAFAAETNDVSYSLEDSTGEVFVTDLGDISEKSETAENTARASITVPASSMSVINVGTISAGKTVTVKASWTPAAKEICIGLMKNGAISGEFAAVTGGSATVKIAVNSTATYNLVIMNRNTTGSVVLSSLTYNIK